MYRCGNSFQDTPCINGNNSKATQSPTKVNGSPAHQSTASALKVDADCKQRGDDAKKIMWLREAGKTQAQQLENTTDYNTKALIRDVYNHRGTSLEVKNAIEQACMQQKEQDKLANQLMLEAQHLKGTNTHQTNIPVSSKVQIESASTDTKIGENQPRTKHNDEDHKTTCSALKDNAERISALRRKGGGANYMNDLKQRQIEIENSTRASGC